MSYAATIYIVQGDNLPGIQANIRDKNTGVGGGFLDKKDPETWEYVDLSDATVSAAIREVGSDTVIDTIPLTVVEPSKGTVLLSMASTNFQGTDGSYELEATLTFSSSGQQTVYDFLRLEVRSRF